MKAFYSLFLVIGLVLPAKAFIYFEDVTQPEFITSARALALGSAYIAKVDDSSAVFYNPAGLGTVRYPHLHLENIHLEVNKGFLDTGTGGSLTDAGSNLGKVFKVDKMQDLLQNNRGVLAHSRFHFMPNFTARYVSFGYLYSTQSRGIIGTQSGARFEYADRTDYGPYAALNISLFGGIVKFGATGVILIRKEVFGEADATADVNLSSSDYRKGRSIQLIGGARVTLPFRGLPTFAVKLNNMSRKGFRASSGSAGAPDRVKPSWDAGFSLTPQVGKVTRVHLELNYKDFTSEYGAKLSRRLTAGVELDLARVAFFRIGYGDGFGSAGIGIRTRSLELDLTTYAVDTTSSGFRGKEDRRFVFSLSSGF